jgi:excisionase family DNA binding protein
MEKKMLSVKEAAGRLGYSSDTVRRRIRDGSIRAAKLPSRPGGKNEYFRISDDEIERLNRPARV